VSKVKIGNKNEDVSNQGDGNNNQNVNTMLLTTRNEVKNIG